MMKPLGAGVPPWVDWTPRWCRSPGEHGEGPDVGSLSPILGMSLPQRFWGPILISLLGPPGVLSSEARGGHLQT